MNDYIAKPVDERVLYAKIAGLIKKPSIVKADETEKQRTDENRRSRCTHLEYLNTRTKSNPTLMMEMISLYLEQTPSLVSAMKRSFLDKDWNSLHAAVHKMIPSFIIMGISEDFENMARKIQDYAGTQQQSDGIEVMVLKLENVLSQSCRELEVEFNTIKNS